jgi:hypothetical protein
VNRKTSKGAFMAKHDQMPKYHELMNPLLKALHDLGASGSVEEISSNVSDSPRLPEDVLAIPHNPDKSSQTEIEYRLAWARTYLKKYGIIDNSERGVCVTISEKKSGKCRGVDDLNGKKGGKRMDAIQHTVPFKSGRFPFSPCIL